MIEYRNVKTGQVVRRPTKDKWLEASVGWVRVKRAKTAEPAAADTSERTEPDGRS